jgi:Ca2+-binding EF-hand superfamily protein
MKRCPANILGCLSVAVLSLAALPAIALSTHQGATTWSNELVCSKKFQEFDHNKDKILSWSEWPGTRALFDSLDTNSDGVLTEVEFSTCKQTGNNDRFDQLDFNRDGVISRKEWAGRMQDFDAMDDNRDGQLTRDEFYRKHEGDQKAFDSLDTNHDGIISPTEWRGKKSDFKKLDTDHNGVITLMEYEQRDTSYKPLIK